MSDLLKRLTTKHKPSKFAIDAGYREVIRRYNDGFVITRAKGMDLPKGWDETWTLVENGYLKEEGQNAIGSNIITYKFSVTPKGKEELNQ